MGAGSMSVYIAKRNGMWKFSINIYANTPLRLPTFSYTHTHTHTVEARTHIKIKLTYIHVHNKVFLFDRGRCRRRHLS